MAKKTIGAASVKVATKIEVWKTYDVKPYPLSAKKHPPEQVQHIARLMAETGFDQPIVVDSKGVIIKGHGRWLAAQKLGLEKVPVVVQAHLTEAQARAARVGDNKVSEFGWDFDALVEDMRGASELEDFNLELSGFNARELGLLEEADDVLASGDDGAKEIEEEEIGEGEHECPRCSFRFD